MLAITPQAIGQDIVLFSAVLGALGVVFRYVVRPAYRFIVAIGEGVEFVRGQMVNNGGSTVRDQVDITAKRVDEMAEAIRNIDSRVEALDAVREKQAVIDEILADNAAKLEALLNKETPS